MKPLLDLFFPRKEVSNGVVALIQKADGLGLLHLSFDLSEKYPLLLHCLFQPMSGLSSWYQVVTTWVQRYALGNARFVGILDPNAYILFPVEVPPVPREEWGMNVRWKIGDRIDYPVGQAVVEVFDLPGRTMLEGSGKIYVAVARDTEVQKHVDLFLKSGLNLLSLDIPELALGRLTDGLEEDAKGLGLLHLEQDGGVVIVRRHQSLFLSRRIEAEWPRMLRSRSSSVMSESVGFELDSTLTALATELRRTFDHYERNFMQSPLDLLFVTPTIIPLLGASFLPEGHTDEIDVLSLLSDKLAMRVQVLPLRKVVRFSPGIQEADLVRCLPALGAALGFAPER